MDNNKKQNIIRVINLIWEIIHAFCVVYIIGVITISLVNIERNLTFLTMDKQKIDKYNCDSYKKIFKE